MALPSERSEPICRACGQQNPADAHFCFACGAGLETPRAVAEERKVVSVLFVDLVGFTERAERLDPEQVQALLAPYWERVREELGRHSGTVEKFVGDAVMALFGAPIAHEDDAERAVRAALAIRDWAREEPGFAVRIGVTTGEVLVRLHARPAAGEGMAVGDVVNTCARLQEAAPVNGVLVDTSTYEATKDVVDYQQAEPVLARGKASPVQGWELQTARRRIARPRARTPFVGRRTQLELLRGLFRRVVDERSPQLVTIVGPPGIGKTRLVDELHHALACEPALEWLHGRALPYGEGMTLSALAEIVKRYVGILETDPPLRAAEKLAHTTRRLLADADEAQAVESHLRALVGLPGTPNVAPDNRVESFAGWRRLFEAIADRRPLVLVLEDLQWADDAMLEFIDHVVEWSATHPILVLCTARPELLDRRATWGGGKSNALTLSLPPLTDDETGALLGALLERNPADVEPGLRRRTGGNPLYAEQFARMIAERGCDDPSLPRTVQAVIGARLDVLAPEEKQLVEDAAVAGSVFWPGAVAAIGGLSRTDVEGLLHRLERKDLVARRHESTVEHEPEYAFRHVLVSDVAYTRITHCARAEKHRRAAEWLEAVGRPEDHAETLAYHYVHALDAARAGGAPTVELELRARLALRQIGRAHV